MTATVFLRLGLRARGLELLTAAYRTFSSQGDAQSGALVLANFAQATRDPALFRQTQQNFVQVYQKLDALKAVTRLEVNLKQIELCRAAAKGYEAAMSNFLKNWLAREELAKLRNQTGDGVLVEARNTSKSSMEASAKTSNVAACTILRQSHVGRVGAYPIMAAQEGMIAIMTADSGRSPKAVAGVQKPPVVVPRSMSSARQAAACASMRAVLP